MLSVISHWTQKPGVGLPRVVAETNNHATGYHEPPPPFAKRSTRSAEHPGITPGTPMRGTLLGHSWGHDWPPPGDGKGRQTWHSRKTTKKSANCDDTTRGWPGRAGEDTIHAPRSSDHSQKLLPPEGGRTRNITDCGRYETRRIGAVRRPPRRGSVGEARHAAAVATTVSTRDSESQPVDGKHRGVGSSSPKHTTGRRFVACTGVGGWQSGSPKKAAAWGSLQGPATYFGAGKG